jgi:rhodanese-related sulfurtransferase
MCASGIRSASAARLLGENGYEAYFLRGGMGAWRQADEPIRQEQQSTSQRGKPWLKSATSKT